MWLNWLPRKQHKVTVTVIDENEEEEDDFIINGDDEFIINGDDETPRRLYIHVHVNYN